MSERRGKKGGAFSGGLDRRTFLKMTGAAAAVGATGWSGLGGRPAWGQSAEKFTFVSFLEPVTIDPHRVTDFPTITATLQAYEPLLKFAPGSKLVPAVAESWSVSDDGRTYTFKIRKGMKFHDGSMVDAAAVKFSIDRALKVNQYPVSFYTDILDPDDVKLVDSDTVQVTLQKPFAPFPLLLVLMYVVNPAVVEANEKDGDMAQEWLNMHSAGSGPYIIRERRVGEGITYDYFPEYYEGWNEKFFPQAEYKIVLELATIVQLLRNAEADQSDMWIPEDSFNELRNAENVAVVESPGDFLPMILHLNNQRAPLNDLHVRKAVAYAINYDIVIEKLLYGKGSKMKGTLPKGMWAHNPDVEESTFNLDEAKKHLDMSGAGKVTIDYVWPSGLDTRRKLGLLMLSTFDQLGINVNVLEFTWANVVEAQKNPQTGIHMTPILYPALHPDPDGLLYLQYYSPLWKDQPPTFFQSNFYDNADVDRMLVQARHGTNQAEREDLYKKIQAQIVADQAAVFLFEQVHQRAVGKTVQGYEHIPPATSWGSHRWNRLWRG